MMIKVKAYQLGLPLNVRGFTLVELIVVCAVLGVLATMALPAYNELTHKAIISKAKTEIRVIERAITAYMIDRNRLPDQLSDIGAEANILDPWKNPYQYYNIGTGTGSGPQYVDIVGVPLNDDYDLYCKGADGITDNDLRKNPGASMDDIIRVSNGAEVEWGSDF